MHALLVLVVSIAPALVLLLVILRMDRQEPEPLRLVLRIMGLGAASAVVASLVELALEGLPLFAGDGFWPQALESFVSIAPVEELCKLGVVLLFAWGKPDFNEENDGVVYVGASAIGFAVLENLSYVVQNGIGVGVTRAFTAVPLHVFTAVIMGLHVGRAHFLPAGPRRTIMVVRGFLLAWALHGTYDALAGAGSALALLILPLVAGLAALGIVTLKQGRRLSLARWVVPADTMTGTVVPPAGEPPVVAARAPRGREHRPHRWMIVVSRLLFVLCAAFWALMVIGLASSETDTSIGDGILGGIFLTLVPAGVGVLLEVRYRRSRQLAG